MSSPKLIRDHFGRIDGTRYIDQAPRFDPREFYNGTVKAWGIIQSRGGNVLARFDGELHGHWQDHNGTLEETFNYPESGRVQRRTWYISKLDDRRYEATADDIVDYAKGTQYGNAMLWQYEMVVPVGNDTHRLKFEDWVWAMPGDTAINRAYLRKFGVTVAELTVFMQKS